MSRLSIGAVLAVVASSAVAVGCGARVDPITPEGPAELGGMRVDPVTERTWVLRSVAADVEPWSAPAVASRALRVVEPDDGRVQKVDDDLGEFDELIDLVFVDEGATLVGSIDADTVLSSWSRESLGPLGSITVPGLLQRVQTSPSGRWLVGVGLGMTDRFIDLVVMSTGDGSFHGLGEGGFGAVAWVPGERDRLLVLADEDGGVRARTFDIEDLAANGFATGADGSWTPVERDFPLDLAPDEGLMRWSNPPVVSPDGRQVVVLDDAETTAVIDLETGQTRRLEGAAAPVRFGEDPSRIVAVLRPALDSGLRDLDVVDAATLDVTTVVPSDQMPVDALVLGRELLISPHEDGGQMTIEDIASGESRPVSGGRIVLGQAVARPSHHEVWATDSASLYRVSLDDATVRQVGLGQPAGRLALLPEHGRLVVRSARGDEVALFDPETETTLAHGSL